MLRISRSSVFPWSLKSVTAKPRVMGCSMQERVFGTALMHAHKEEVSCAALCLLVMMGTYVFCFVYANGFSVPTKRILQVELDSYTDVDTALW